MNYRTLCAALVVLAGLAASASAADRISKSTLASMGLSSLQQISDSEGLAIRGKGTSASVWGQSTANFFGGQTSTNGYQASSSHYYGPSSAVGANISVAGAVHGNNGNISFIVVGAAGASFARAQ